MRNYLVSESELKALLIASFILDALEHGGVDNWLHCYDAIQDFIKGWKEENCTDPSEDLSIEDIAEIELEGYVVA